MPSKTIHSVKVEIGVDCNRCMRPIMVEDVAAEVRCRACLHHVALDWHYLAHRETTDALSGQGGGRVTGFTDNFIVVSRIGPGDPACPGCGVGIDPRGLVDDHTCDCGAVLPVRAAGAIARTIHRRVVAVAGGRRAERVDAVEPVAFRCPGCDGGLRATGATRSVACAECAHDVDVPEALWDVLYPIRPRMPLYVLIGDEQ